HRRDRGYGAGCGGRVAVVALRPPRQPRAVLPGDGGVSPRVRRAARDLWLPRDDGSQHLSVQRAAALGDGALRPRRHLRSVPQLSPRHASAWLAAGQHDAAPNSAVELSGGLAPALFQPPATRYIPASRAAREDG